MPPNPQLCDTPPKHLLLNSSNRARAWRAWHAWTHGWMQTDGEDRDKIWVTGSKVQTGRDGIGRSEVHSPAAPLSLVRRTPYLLASVLLLSALSWQPKGEPNLNVSSETPKPTARQTLTETITVLADGMRNEQPSEIRPPSHRPTKPSTSQHLTSSPIRLSRLESPCSVFLGANSNSRVQDSFAKQDWPQTSLQSWSHFVCSFLISVRLATPAVSSRRMPCPAHSG